MQNLSRFQQRLSWLMQFLTAGILLQTLYFKFTGAPESVYIFSSVGSYVHIASVEPWGRLGSGVAELIASLLLLMPATAVFGALLAIGVLSGAILSHIFILGIEVQGDGGLLFALGVTAFVASAIIVLIRRAELPVVGPMLQPMPTGRSGALHV
ncbi:MAG: hypothetical protein U0Q11_17080 [Vicinamibacterales bacterium]